MAYVRLAEWIYANRYELAFSLNLNELSEQHHVNAGRLARYLIDEFGLDYTEFRREVLRCWVYFNNPTLKMSDMERVLNLSKDTIRRLKREIGIT